MATEEKKLEAESIKQPPASSGSSSKVSVVPLHPGLCPVPRLSRVHIRTSGLIWSE